MQLAQNTHSTPFLIAEICGFRKMEFPFPDANSRTNRAAAFPSRRSAPAAPRISNRQTCGTYEKLELMLNHTKQKTGAVSNRQNYRIFVQLAAQVRTP
jgi:hypothetical protein